MFKRPRREMFKTPYSQTPTEHGSQASATRSKGTQVHKSPQATNSKLSTRPRAERWLRSIKKQHNMTLKKIQIWSPSKKPRESLQTPPFRSPRVSLHALVSGTWPYFNRNDFMNAIHLYNLVWTPYQCSYLIHPDSKSLSKPSGNC